MALTKSESIWASATETDEEGLRHLLLCRLILGKPELIISDSKQSYPSSIEFDSGVDNLHNPRKYVIWSSAMNSYILRVISSVSGLLVSEVVFMQDRARRGLEEAAKKKIYVSVLSARVISLPSYQVTLEAEVSNKGALALYGRLRFIRAKRLHHYYLNGMDAFRLKLLFPKPRLPQIASQYQTQQEQENFTG